MDELTDGTPLTEEKEVLAMLREKYLFAFRNAMLFGKCAGTVTELPLLHRATLTLELEKAAEDSSHIEQLRTQIEFTEGEIENEYARMRDGRANKQDERSSNILILQHKLKYLRERLNRGPAKEAIAKDADPKEPHPIDLAKIEYNGLLDELRKADDYLQSEYEKAKRTNRWDSIADRPWVRESLTRYIIEMIDELFRERSLNIISLEQVLQSHNQKSQENEATFGTVARGDYFGRMEEIGKEIKPIKQQMENLESLCDYRFIRDEFRSEIYPMVYGRAWKVQTGPQNYEELMLAMETSTQNDPTKVLRIFGDPGQGKSTLLQQLAYDFATNQLVHQKDHMPFYFKAKHIARLGTTLLSEGALGTVERINNEPFLDDFRTEEIVDALFESDADLKEYITREELIQLIHLEGEDANAKPRCIFIDAFDECSTVADQEFVREFIKNEVEDFHSNIIVTCRTTHRDSLQIESNNAYTCLLRYSEQELRREMPKKLSDAWGINRDMLTIPTNLYFDKYQSVLSHPLYVGWFCFLLRNNKLQVAEQPDIEIMKGNSALNELHIAFLEQVIEVGIEISIAEKYPTKIDEFNQEKIFDLFCLIAANYFTMNTQNLDVILTRIQRVHPTIQITEDEDDFIRNNMGLLFVNDEHALEFTHETLPEVALGIIFEHERFADEYLPKSAEESGLMHRRDLINSSAWSQCIVLTRAVLQKRDESEKTLKDCIIDLLPSVPGPFIEQTIGMLTTNNGPIISVNNDGLEPYMRHETIAPSADQITLNEIGQKYIQSIENNERFPLKFPERFHNASDTPHPVDVIYQHSTIFDCSDLLIAEDVLRIMQHLSLTSAPRILDLWTEEGEIDNPVLLEWYLGHVRHGLTMDGQNFQRDFLDRLSWDGQRIRQEPSLSMARSRFILGLEYALSLSADIRGSHEEHIRLLAESVFTNQSFLDHILLPVKQNEDIDLVFLIERYGERLRKAIRKEPQNLSKSIARIMIKRPPVRNGQLMTDSALELHIEALLSGHSMVTDAFLQYAAAVIWSACKTSKLQEFGQDNLADTEFWSLFGFEKSQITHPITMIYSKSKKKIPSVLLDLMDILLPYIGTDARQKDWLGEYRKVVLDLDNILPKGKYKTFSRTIQGVLSKEQLHNKFTDIFKPRQTQDD
jgi:hypothetical protein